MSITTLIERLKYGTCEQDIYEGLEELLKLYKAEQKESVLDKIKAEIEQLKLHKAQFITSDNKVCIDSQEVLDIIDRYKEESEEKDHDR